MKKVRNKTEIRFFGMKRSGNHAVVVWLAQHYKSPIYFLNNIKPFEDPFEAHYDWRRVKNTVDLRPKIVPKEVLVTQVREQPKKCLLYSYEDLDLRQLANRELVANHDEAIGPSQDTYDFVLLRDHYNMLASRIKNWENEGTTVSVVRAQKDLELWKVYCREYLNETSFLKNNKIPVNYNRWFDNEDYRKTISARIGKDFTDAGKEVVTPIGKGSSFDGREFNSNASEMGVLTRWQLMLDNDVLKEVAQDEEAIALSQSIFAMEAPAALFQ
ncbi:MAG TPA: hypothetical protein VHL34_15795 [Rhizomicrobium sp.]|nr:hypothetical protein [Rhizomicrobium sp.]